MAPRVGRLHCIDPSSALAVARQALVDQPIVRFHQASVAASGLPPNSQDFSYPLGVLHHVPNIAAAIRSCTELVKHGSPCCSTSITRQAIAPAGFECSGSSPTPPAC